MPSNTAVTLFDCRQLLFTGFSLAVVMLFSIPADANSDWRRGDPVTPEATQALLTRKADAWRASLPSRRPRLFFRFSELETLRDRRAQASGRAREWFDMLDEAARDITSAPIIQYRPPEEMAPGRTLFDARQELWQREVGNNMVVLGIVLLLHEDAEARAALRDMVLAACKYPQWGFNWQNRPNSDLAAAHLSRAIAIARDWHPELWNAEEHVLIRGVIRERTSALRAKLDTNGALQSNHNHVVAAAVALCGVAFFDEISEAPEWVAAAELNMENAFHHFPPDGGSTEGVPYGSYSLTAVMEFIEGTRHVLGSARHYREPHLVHYPSYRVHASLPGFAGVLPWGDSPARDYYGPHHILYRLASEYGDGTGAFLANHLPFRPNYKKNSARDIIGWTALWYDPDVPERPPARLDHHATSVDLVNTRSGWDGGDYLLAIKSGYNNRNHSHLDAGALAWISGGDRLLTTPGYGRGLGNADFWHNQGARWEYFSNSTESHSTLLVNGRNQRFGKNDRGTIDTFASTVGWCLTAIDLSDVYDGTRRVRREILHRRGDYALVFDEIESDGGSVTVEWLAQTPPGAAIANDDGVLSVCGQNGRLDLQAVLPVPARFFPRAPTRARVDVPTERLATHALRAEGETVAFIVALMPGRVDRPPPAIRIETRAMPEGRMVTVRGDDWRDEILLAPAGRPCVWRQGEIRTDARLAAIRFVNGEARSLLVVGAREVSLPGDRKRIFASPMDAEFFRLASGEWECTPAGK